MKVIKEFNLIDNNSYRLNAICKKAYFPNNESDFLNIFRETNKKIVIGNGNNLILRKERYDEEFLILNNCYDKIIFEDTQVSAEAGASLLQLSLRALEHSLSGFEMFYDIPSSVGGAVVMNAGSSGEEIKDLLIKVRFLDLTNLSIKEMKVDELDFKYRNSFFQKNPDKLVLKAWFQLKNGDRNNIYKKMAEIKTRRWSKQPREYPNCGSVFKRPPGRFVGPMLDELGLKGFKIGGAQVSTKHSGFIVNTGNATGQNIIDLIEHIKKAVRERFEVDLEVEQRIV
ncbi:MAG TPA: UDP-N-acetylmuramate dehydrogenase [Salegentibacter sp.]|uniref:UDP-N-acetylmuramate dehydrogenase n=1 Tax=Salegentibacter sp. TaxID=1903072 RepID=UPI002F94A919